MKKRLASLLLVSFISATATGALATTYTFSSLDGTTNSANADMNDLEHGYYYGWSIANSDAKAFGTELSKGAMIKSATLVFKNIWNWSANEKDQLNSFLLAAPPPVPGKSETVPVVVDGVPQGKTIYYYTKTTTTTSSSSYIATPPAKFQPPTGYVVQSYVTKVSWGNTYYKYTYTKTTTSTKNNTTGAAPSGYKLTSTKFVQDMVTLGDGIPLSSNLWERSDQQSLTDIDWGVESYRIQDVNGDPANPWDDPVGGYARNFDLIYDLDEASINKLFEFAVDGSFGFGIDPDCHYYNDGVFFTVETADNPVPEPSTLVLFGAGLAAGVAFMGRKKKA